MAVSILDTRTVVTEADSLTGWTGHRSPEIFTSSPDPVELSSCIGVQVSTETGWLIYTAGGSVDLSAGVLVYVWVLANGIMDTTVNGGIQLIIGDGTNTIGFHIAGSDKAVFRHSDGSVAWQCLVLDTGNLPSDTTAHAGSAGSLDLTAITEWGGGFKTLVKSVGGTENCFVDVIRYGNEGLIVLGGTSGDPGTFEEIAAEDVDDTDGKAYGIIREIGSSTYSIQGSLTFGSTGSTDTYFKDLSTILLFEDRDLLDDKYKITITGSSTSTTEFYLGTKAGTGDDADGLDGCSITVPATSSAEFICTHAEVDEVGIYGSTFSGFTEGMTFNPSSNGAGHELAGSKLSENGVCDLGQMITRNCTFTVYTETSASLIWNDDINIKNCEFTNNSSSLNDSAGIQHLQTGSFTYDNLTFAGNDYDIFNNSLGLVTIAATNGSDPGTSINTGASSTVINNSKTHTVTGLETGSRVIWIRVSDDAELENQPEASGEAAYVYNYAGDVDVDVQILSLTSINKIITTTLTADNVDLPAGQTTDRFYFNP